MEDRVKLCGSIVISLGFFYVIKRLFWSGGRKVMPRGKWRQVGVVSGLNIYPIESCKAMPLEEARVTQMGLEEIPQRGQLVLGDRRLVIINSNNEAVSSATHEQLLRLKAEPLTDMKIVLTYDFNSTTVTIPFHKNPDTTINTNSGNISMVDCGSHVANWLQSVIFDGKPGFRLCAHPITDAKRDVDVDTFARCNMTCEMTGSGSEFPFLLLNESSIEDLNNKIALTNEKASASCKNFRGNILIHAAPYEEDNWEWIKIGTIVFRKVKHSVKCAIQNVDADNTKRTANYEPLTTLITHRMLEDETREVDPYLVLGTHLSLWAPNRGFIKVGDPVNVCE